MSRDPAFYAVTARWLAWAGTLLSEHQHFWLPNQIFDDHETWTMSHLVYLKSIQSMAVSKYGCLLADDNMTVPANAAPAARATQMSSDDVSLQPTIYPPQLNHLCKVHKPVNLIGLE